MLPVTFVTPSGSTFAVATVLFGSVSLKNALALPRAMEGAGASSTGADVAASASMGVCCGELFFSSPFCEAVSIGLAFCTAGELARSACRLRSRVLASKGLSGKNARTINATRIRATTEQDFARGATRFIRFSAGLNVVGRERGSPYIVATYSVSQ